MSGCKKYKGIDIFKTLKKFKSNLNVYDPIPDPDQVKIEYNISLLESIENIRFDAVIIAVAHEIFKNLNLKNIIRDKSVIYDVKGLFNQNFDGKL